MPTSSYKNFLSHYRNLCYLARYNQLNQFKVAIYLHESEVNYLIRERGYQTVLYFTKHGNDDAIYFILDL